MFPPSNVQVTLRSEVLSFAPLSEIPDEFEEDFVADGSIVYAGEWDSLRHLGFTRLIEHINKLGPQCPEEF